MLLPAYKGHLRIRSSSHVDGGMGVCQFLNVFTVLLAEVKVR